MDAACGPRRGGEVIAEHIRLSNAVLPIEIPGKADYMVRENTHAFDNVRLICACGKHG